MDPNDGLFTAGGTESCMLCAASIEQGRIIFEDVPHFLRERYDLERSADVASEFQDSGQPGHGRNIVHVPTQYAAAHASAVEPAKTAMGSGQLPVGSLR